MPNGPLARGLTTWELLQLMDNINNRTHRYPARSEALMPIYGSGGSFTTYGSTVWTTTSGWSTAQPRPTYSTNPADYSRGYLAGCTCGTCRDAERYANGENFDSQYLSQMTVPSDRRGTPLPRPATTEEIKEHFGFRRVYQPTQEFITLMTQINQDREEQLMIPIPIPPPNIITVPHRLAGRNPIMTITADTLAGHDFAGANLHNADFTGMDLTGANFSRCSMENTKFTEATLTGANFDRAYLYSVDFTRADASEASFIRATVEYPNVRNATFDNAVFDSGSFYSPNNPSTASFDGASFEGTSGITTCDGCGQVSFGNLDIVHCNDIGEYRCADCGHAYCDECDEYNADGYDHEQNCSARYNRFLHEWDYRPRRYKPKGNYPTEALMGVELEVGGNKSDLTKIVNDLDPSENHLYCKRDGSVNGIEVVTHPMTLNWAKTSFDFSRLIASLGRQGHESTEFGLHVHVSRNAFSTYKEDTDKRKPQPTHQYAWLMFMYRNSDRISLLARRGATGYSSWSKPNTVQMKNKAARPDSDSRYVAINCNNERTYEVRCFKTTLDFTEFMAAIEFVDASVNYTRGMTAVNILKNEGMTWQSFFEWTATQGARYSNLRKEMIKLTGVSYNQ